jgi:hypothetical protein
MCVRFSLGAVGLVEQRSVVLAMIGFEMPALAEARSNGQCAGPPTGDRVPLS